MRNTVFFSVVVFGLVSGVFYTQARESVRGEDTPNERARKLAESQARPRRMMERLKHQARLIRKAGLREDTLKILETPEFRVLSARAEQEAEIIAKLKSEGLLGSAETTLFPKTKPMAFIAAPGGPWAGHHAYPAGLVYHTLTNLMLGLSYSKAYREIYDVKLNEDWIRLGAIWHDCAKTLSITWNANGSANSDEAKIANTAAHHIWGIAEALYRKYPSDFVVVLASAHNPPMPGKDLEALIGFLKASAVIAGVSYESAGLTADGKALAKPAPIEAFINHLDDHDYVFSIPSMHAAARFLDAQLGGHPDFWKRNELLSAQGDYGVYLKATQRPKAR